MTSPVVARVVDAAMEATVAPSFARLGATVRSRLSEWPSPPDGALEGKVAVVTGATSGIGAALAHGLAGAGADVHLVGRDDADTSRFAGYLLERTRAERVRAHHADLSSLADVRHLAEELADLDRVDVLAHVAGALVHERQLTSDGIELTVQVHVVAPFLLTHLLLDQLAAAGDARVLTMSSGGMYTQRLDVDALLAADGDFDGTVAYARAKRAQVVLNAEWARRHPDLGVGFHALHPGWVDTPGLQRSLPGFAGRLHRFLRTPEQGADTALWLSWSPDVVPPGGGFWHDRRRRHVIALPWTSSGQAEADRLWRRTRQLAGVHATGAVR